MSTHPEDNEAFVSTGRLPNSDKVTAIVTEAYERFRDNTDGANSGVYPALERVPSKLFGICVVATRGKVFGIGDTDYEFAIMSASKPFVFALLFQSFSAEEVRQKVGAKRHGVAIQLSRGCRGERIWSNKSDGECRRNCDDEFGSRRDT